MPLRRLAAATLALSLTATAPAFAAADKPAPQKDPEALATEGIQNLMRAMELLIMSIPQYEAPYMNENGDIIIKRKHPQAAPEAPAKPSSPQNEHRKAI